MRLMIRSALIAVAAGAALLLHPAVSSAAEFTIHSCSRAAGIGEAASAVGWWPTSSQGHHAAAGSCPDGLTLSAEQSFTQGQMGASWAFGPSRALLELTKLKAVVEGDGIAGGFEYGVRQCATGCPLLGTIPVLGEQDGQQEFEISLPRVKTVVISARCVVAVCEPTHKLKFHDVRFTVDDDEPPRISFLDRPWDGNSVPMNWYSWSSRDAFASTIHVHDSGAGLSLVSARIDSEPAFLSNPACSVLESDTAGIYHSVSLPCAETSAPGQLDGSDLEDGWHTLTVDARDAAGNSIASYERRFAIDGTPPAVPEDAVFAGVTPDGWTAQTAVGLSWMNRPDDSGIKFARYQFVKRGPVPQPQQPVLVSPSGASRDSLAGLIVPEDGSWDLYLWLEDAVGNVGGKLKLWIGRDRTAPPKPSLNTMPWLNRSGLAGSRQSWTIQQDPALESGVCGYSVDIDGTPDAEPVGEITQRGAATNALLPADLPEGVSYFHLRSVSCAGIASETASTPLRVDDTPPQVTVDGPSGAGAELQISAVDSLAGVAAVEYEIDGRRSTLNGAKATVPLEDGRHAVSARAIDNAGNRSQPVSLEVDVDRSPPTAQFDLRDAQDPSLLRARVIDAGSGIASARVEFRRLDVEDAWHAIGGQTTGTPHALDIEARIPDESLPDGLYAVRLAIADFAGNAAFSEVAAGGMPMRIVLPLRVRPKLTAELARLVKRCVTASGRVCHKSDRCASRSGACRKQWVASDDAARSALLTGYGVRVALVGSLADESGRPLPGRPLRVYEGAEAPRLLAEIVTAPDGRFRYDLPNLTSSRISVRSALTATSLAAGDSTQLGVRAPVSLSVSPRRTRVGRSIVFKGRLGGLESLRSVGGKLVQIEFRNGSRWQSIGKLLRSDPSGRFSAVHTFVRAIERPTRYRFRAFVPREAGWPFEDGGSTPVAVKVLPR